MGKVVLVPMHQFVMAEPKYPCRSCVYMFICGSSSRTEYCGGRITKTMANRHKNFKEVADETYRRRQTVE